MGEVLFLTFARFTAHLTCEKVCVQICRKNYRSAVMFMRLYLYFLRLRFPEYTLYTVSQ
jgi:hypothetical protein